jgi:hypothetical protein
MANHVLYHLYLKYMIDSVFRDPNLLLIPLQKREESEVLGSIWDKLWENIAEWAKGDPIFAASFGEYNGPPDIAVIHINSEDEIQDSLNIFIFPYDFEDESSWPPLYWAVWCGETGVRQFCFFFQDHKHGNEVRWMIEEISSGEERIGQRIFDVPEMSPQRFAQRVTGIVRECHE